MSRERKCAYPEVWGERTLTTSSAGSSRWPGLQVIALVGPSGTGKSHRASIVAGEVGADAILDDGLLIAGGKILAGKSAKREPNRVAATRRALLQDPVHAADIREALARLRPSRLLVISISEEMVMRICEVLDLGRPDEIIPIERFASPRQMRKARQVRSREGKHVIPAPTLEVRKSFAGYAVTPVNVFVRVREQRPAPGQFVEKSVVRPTWSSLGRFYIEEVVLAAIAARAAAETAGVGRVFQTVADSREGGVSFDLAIGVFYGCPLREVASSVARQVRGMVEHMTGLTCRQVEVSVSAVLPPAGSARPGSSVGSVAPGSSVGSVAPRVRVQGSPAAEGNK